MLTLIKQTLQAGIIEDDQWHRSDKGVPQGAVISPLLANIYLHYVIDLWAHQWRSKKANGEIYIVRYADDMIIGFQHREEDVLFRYELETRLKQFDLELHPVKTKLIEFGRFAKANRPKLKLGKPETFALSRSHAPAWQCIPNSPLPTHR